MKQLCFFVALCAASPFPAFAQQLDRSSGTLNRQARATAATPARDWRFALRADGIFDAGSAGFSETVRVTKNVEEARFENSYRGKSGPSFAVAGILPVWRRLEAGLGVQRFSRSTPVHIQASVPHPFFFERDRTFEGDTGAATRKELAVHLHLATSLDVGERFLLRAFGGPTWFDVRQGLISDVTVAEEYPYDTASFRSAAIREGTGSGVGGHVGGDLSYFLTRQFGIGGTVTFSTGRVSVDAGSGRRKIDAGGVSGGAGVRVRF